MTTKLDEFAINLPMAGVTGVGSTGVASVPAPAYGYHDITSEFPMPVDVSQSCEHVRVNVDSATATNFDASNPMLTVDLVLNVSIANPVDGSCSSYKLVKRLSMDKCKLALQAEVETPYQVVEGITPAQIAELAAIRLAEQQAAERVGQAVRRVRELAGLPVLAEAKKTYSDYHEWINACRKKRPNSQVSGNENQAQMVDWDSNNNQEVGNWNGTVGAILV